jgi:hypothetical protein
VNHYRLAPQFLRDFRALEPGLSPADQGVIDALFTEVVRHPDSPRRIQSFYDPMTPSWLLRSDRFLVHYAVDDQRGEVILLNVFWRR